MYGQCGSCSQFGTDCPWHGPDPEETAAARGEAWLDRHEARMERDAERAMLGP